MSGPFSLMSASRLGQAYCILRSCNMETTSRPFAVRLVSCVEVSTAECCASYGPYLRCLPDYADGFGHVSNLEGDIAQGHLLIGGDRYSAAFVSFESALLDTQVVGIRLHGNHGKRPGLISRGSADFRGSLAGHGNFGAGDGVPGRVHHVAGDGSGGGHLGERNPHIKAVNRR